MPRSKCATDNNMKKCLFNLLGDQQLVTTLLYRGSDDGWELEDFHSRCDGKGPTITLLQVKDGDCIGGYTKAQWSSPSSPEFCGDDEAFLFNLTCNRHFPSRKTGNDINCLRDTGPCFNGGSEGELDVVDSPFNGDGKCFSSVNNPGFEIPQDGNGLNMLTNQQDGNFTITEIEVWEVTYE